MTVDLAETLARDYLNKVASESSVHTLMDFFSDDRAKRALHSPLIEMSNVCINYQTKRPAFPTNLQQGMTKRALNSFNRITPIRPASTTMSRLFSTQGRTSSSDDSDLDKEDDSSRKGRFFKFLEKAEALDEKIRKSPEEAKKVGKDAEEKLEVMFDPDEIEISFAGQAPVR